MENKQTPESIRNWVKAVQITEEKTGNMCRCGSILTREHAVECRIFRAEVSREFHKLETKQEALTCQ